MEVYTGAREVKEQSHLTPLGFQALAPHNQPPALDGLKQQVRTDGNGFSASCVPGAGPATEGEPGQSGYQMNMAMKSLYCFSEMAWGPDREEVFSGSSPSTELSSLCLGNPKHILNTFLNDSCLWLFGACPIRGPRQMERWTLQWVWSVGFREC